MHKQKSIPGTWWAKLAKIESSPCPPSHSNLKGMWSGRAIRSDPFGISPETTSPRPVVSSWAIFTAGCTKPPSLRTHFMRSGGCGTRRAGKEADAEAVEAHVRARQWVREAITIFEVAMLEPLQYSLTHHSPVIALWDFLLSNYFSLKIQRFARNL